MHFELGLGLICYPVGLKVATVKIPEKNLCILVDKLYAHVVRFPSHTGGIARLTLPPSPSHSSTNSSPHPSSNPPWHSHARSAGASLHRRTPMHRSFRLRSSLDLPCSARERSPRLLAPLELTSQSHIQSWVEHTIKPTSHPDTMLRARVAKLTKWVCTHGYDCTAKTSFMQRLEPGPGPQIASARYKIGGRRIGNA